MRIQKLPASYMRFVLPLVISIIMSCIVSGVSTLRSVGLGPEMLHLWPGNWLVSWMIAFPVLLLVMPVARRIAGLFVAS
jgi:hypothetical protein